MMPDKKYWENVRARTAISDGLTTNVDVQTYRYANISPVRAWTDPIPMNESL
jgi:hypothetical protein